MFPTRVRLTYRLGSSCQWYANFAIHRPLAALLVICAPQWIKFDWLGIQFHSKQEVLVCI